MNGLFAGTRYNAAMSEKSVRFVELCSAGSLAELEESWLGVFSDPPKDPGTLGGILDQAVRTIRALQAADENKLAASLVGVVPEDIEKNSEPGTRLAFAQMLAEYAPQDPSVRRRLRDAYRKKYKRRRGLDPLLELSGVYKEEVLPADVVKMMDQLLRYEEGATIRHSSWGTGKIKKVDRFTAELVIDFDSRKNHRMAPDAAILGLEVLPADDFDAMAFADPDAVKLMIKKEPLKALKLVLKTMGGKATANHVRDKLRDTFLEGSRWSGWWTRVKKLALADPYIEVVDERPVKLTLREEAKSFIDEVIEQMQASRRFALRWEIASRYLKHSNDGADKIWAELADDLSGSLEERDEDDYPSLLAAALERGTPLDGFVALDDLPELWITLSQSGQRTLGDAILAGREDCRELLVDTFWMTGCRVRPWIRETLLELDPVLLAGIDAAIVQDPTRFPERFLTLADWVLTERWVASDSTNNPLELVIDLMVLIRSFERGRSASKDYVRPAMKLLTENNCAWVLKVINEAEESRVVRAARLLHGSDSLEQLLYQVGPALTERLPDLNLESDTPFWEKVELLVSRESKEKHRAKLQEMMDREMPEVEKQIGHAASFGDLSENSEWTAAIERRNQLVQRIETMKHELQICQVLEGQPIDDAHVCPGTRVRIQRLDKDEPERELTILGPWDVDVEAGILSYKSPLAGGLLGHNPGDEVLVQLPDGSASYRVIEIAKAL